MEEMVELRQILGEELFRERLSSGGSCMGQGELERSAMREDLATHCQ